MASMRAAGVHAGPRRAALVGRRGTLPHRTAGALPAGAVLAVGIALLTGCAVDPMQHSAPHSASEPAPPAVAAACAAPTATIEPRPVRADEPFTVRGDGWAPCLDVIAVDETGETTTPGDEGPWTVTISWVEAGERVELASLQPADGSFVRELTAPASAGSAATSEATIEVASAGYPPGVTLPVAP